MFAIKNNYDHSSGPMVQAAEKSEVQIFRVISLDCPATLADSTTHDGGPLVCCEFSLLLTVFGGAAGFVVAV